jgi:hypothetical protein
VGLIGPATGLVIGLVIMLSEAESTVAGAATVSVSIALGALVYLVSKVLDRR